MTGTSDGIPLHDGIVTKRDPDCVGPLHLKAKFGRKDKRARLKHESTVAASREYSEVLFNSTNIINTPSTIYMGPTITLGMKINV